MISPKTAGNHIEHIYMKIDATNRATASLFAMQHGLLPEEQTDPDLDASERWGDHPMTTRPSVLRLRGATVTGRSP